MLEEILIQKQPFTASLTASRFIAEPVSYLGNAFGVLSVMDKSTGVTEYALCRVKNGNYSWEESYGPIGYCRDTVQEIEHVYHTQLEPTQQPEQAARHNPTNLVTRFTGCLYQHTSGELAFMKTNTVSIQNQTGLRYDQVVKISRNMGEEAEGWRMVATGSFYKYPTGRAVPTKEKRAYLVEIGLIPAKRRKGRPASSRAYGNRPTRAG